LAYQGAFHKSVLHKSKLPEKDFTPDGLEFFDSFNFMKIGLVYADTITTVSEKYAEEIRSDDELSCGLKGVLAKRKKDLQGITNGIDENIWSPEADELIVKNYDFATVSEGKLENKQALLKKLKLPYDEHKPVIGIISRLVDHKGINLIQDGFEKLMALDAQFILLGTGQKEYEDFFRKMSANSKYESKFSATISFNDELAHLIEAGADMFLMPSQFEPSGMNQMYSLKYGTIPIVRATGGLYDSVKPFKNGKGNGFLFEKYAVADMLKCVKEALDTYKKPKEWQKLLENAMKSDCSWESSAEKYNALYHKLVEGK
jgi:starch synthase